MSSLQETLALSEQLKAKLKANAQAARDKGDWYVADQLAGMLDQLETECAQMLHGIDQKEAKINQIETTQAELDSLAEQIRKLKGDNPDAT